MMYLRRARTRWRTRRAIDNRRGSIHNYPMDRYSRQSVFAPIGAAGQARIRSARILVVGCGAIGTHTSEILARAGAGSLVLVDRDVVEWTNLHRQGAFEEAHARDSTPKAEALASWLSRVNSDVRIEAHIKDFNASNALDLAAGSSLLLDGSDNVPARFLLNDLSYSLGVPWIYAGAVGGEARVQLFGGKRGPCLRCQMPELPPPGSLGTCDSQGVVGPAPALAAAWQSALALRFLAEGSSPALEGKLAVLSPWDLRARIAAVEADPGCPVCASRRFEALDGAHAERATLVCGRGAVQVLPAAGRREAIDLAAMASRLDPLGPVERRPRLLRVRAHDGFHLTLFEDGRALFEGVTDTTRALGLYARWIGQ
ncbi:MAG TPA: ThiF family adenylyltransferase [Planctomycetota bacterium]|nr:ThiF family adenylyltransferase [Planctomycetota bacterium]